MVAIMTDTNSGITVQEGRENGIYVLPMPVIVDNHCFMEGSTSPTRSCMKRSGRIGLCTHRSRPRER